MDSEEHNLMTECRQSLESEIALRRRPELSSARKLKGFTFLSAKPVLVLFNNEDEDDAAPPSGGLAETETCAVIKGRLEQELAQMDPEEAAAFLEEFNIAASAMVEITPLWLLTPNIFLNASDGSLLAQLV